MGKCSNCGADNPEYSAYCGKCGAELGGSAMESPSTEPMPVKTQQDVGQLEQPIVSTPPQLMKCMYCGRQVNAKTLYCPFCGKNPRGPWSSDGQYQTGYYENTGSSYSEDYIPRSDKASGGLVLGGVFAILAGVLALGQGVVYAGLGSTIAVAAPSGSLCLCGGLDILFGLGSILGGVSAIQRKAFGLALLGAILGMLGLGLLIGGLFGLIALVLIATSKNEFED